MPLLDRDGYDRMVGDAIAEGRGFATGKIGGSERAWLHYVTVMDDESDPRRRRAFELALAHRAGEHAGIYPLDQEFLGHFAGIYATAVGRFDAIGIPANSIPDTCAALAPHAFSAPPVDSFDQEPERSLPVADESRCWLRHLRGRRVLIVCPFAEVLRARANRSDYEATWAKIGKRWFEPSSSRRSSSPTGTTPRPELATRRR